MRSLLLVAASGLAREVLALERARGRFADYLVVDDDQQLWGTSVDGALVVGGVERVADLDECDVLICAGRGRSRRALAQRLADLGTSPVRYTRVVHPSVDVPDGCEVGAGSILLAGTVLTTAVRVGTHVVAMPHVTLTHDCVVDDYATLCAGVSLGGSTRVGEAAYVGMNASVREGTTLGAGSTLGMGSVLLQDLPAEQTWAGVPATPITPRGAVRDTTTSTTTSTDITREAQS